MAEPKKKNIKMLLVYLVVALALISSYAAFGNNNTTSTTISTTTTVAQGGTVFASGSSNATVVGYSSIALLKLATNTTGVYDNVTNLLEGLQANGSVNTYIPNGADFGVSLGPSLSPYALQQMLGNRSLNVTVISNTTVELPNSIALYYGKTEIPIETPNTTAQIVVTPLRGIGTTLPVGIHAIVSQYGQVQGSLGVVYNGTG